MFVCDVCCKTRGSLAVKLVFAKAILKRDVCIFSSTLRQPLPDYKDFLALLKRESFVKVRERVL